MAMDCPLFSAVCISRYVCVVKVKCSRIESFTRLIIVVIRYVIKTFCAMFQGPAKLTHISYTCKEKGLVNVYDHNK